MAKKQACQGYDGNHDARKPFMPMHYRLLGEWQANSANACSQSPYG